MRWHSVQKHKKELGYFKKVTKEKLSQIGS